MPDKLEIRTLKRENAKFLSLAPKVKHEDEPAAEATRRSPSSSVKEQLDSLEVLVDFKLDLMPEDFELKDLVTMENFPASMSGQVSLAQHAASGVLMARRVIDVSHNSKNHDAIKKELQIMRDCSSQFLVQCYGAFYNLLEI